MKSGDSLGARLEPVGGPGEFSPFFVPSYRCWRSFTTSLALHGLLIPSLPWLAGLFPDSSGGALRNFQVVVRPIEIQMPEILYAPAGGSPRDRDAAPPRKPLRQPAEVKRDERKPDARTAPARRFELPELARRVDAAQTVLQPQYPPDLALQAQVRLPNVVLWSASRLPRPEPKPFVKPGSPAPTAPKAPVLDAPPRLELPNREVAVSDLKMTGGVVLQNPALPRPPSTTVPVRVFRPPAPGASGGLSLDAIAGEPANVIALSSDPAPIGRSIIVPAGNQLGRLPGAPGEISGAGSAAGSGGGEGGSGSSGGAPGGAGERGGSGPGSRGAGRGPGSGSGGSAGSGTGTGGGSGSGSGQPGFPGADAGPRGAQAIAVANLPPALPGGVATRIVHPNNAVFDVVVHSASSGAVPDTTGILSGKPVYTVYVSVGYERDWILQYCRPASTERRYQSDSNVVTLDAPAPVKAPYPLVTVMPPAAQEPRSEPVLVHGFLDTAGKFKGLKLLQEPSRDFRWQLVPFLEQWQFRPGTRDGVPVLLEILLVIPANRA